MMRKVLPIMILILSAGCTEDDPDKYTSLYGQWIVRTPDQMTSIGLTIYQRPDDPYLVNQINVVHNGNPYNTRPIDSGIQVTGERTIESIMLLNTTQEEPYFVIRFTAITVHETFESMQISHASLNIDGEFRQFEALEATRK